MRPTAISAARIQKKRKVFAETTGAVVLFAGLLALFIAGYLGFMYCLFAGIKFVWAAYPLNYWQTVVGFFIITILANIAAAPFRRKSEPE